MSARAEDKASVATEQTCRSIGGSPRHDVIFGGRQDVGSVDADRGVCDLNVAIRTFTLTGDRTTFGVGGGIVADSDPETEWNETELKARRLLEIASG